MKRISAKNGALVGALLLVGAIWVFDHSSGGSRPETLQAAQSTGDAQPVVTLDWEPVAETVEQLTRGDYTSVIDELDRLEHDVFLPGPELTFTTTLDELEGAGLAAVAEPEDVAATPGFAARHKLPGVVVGVQPLAVVDGLVLPLNSDLDGYMLVDVQRDYVVFADAASGERVTLELKRNSQTP
jgi:hypothetical protein